MKVDSAEVAFYDADGKTVATAIIYPETDKDCIFSIPEKEAAEYAEATIQLRENDAYEYELKSGSPLIIREEPGILRRSRSTHGHERGRITPGLNVGTLQFALKEPHDDSIRGVASVEVQSTKVGYRDDFRIMLDYIARQSTDLILEFQAPSTGPIAPDPGRSPETICQRFAFVRAILTSREFQDAVYRVIAMPHRQWQQDLELFDIHKGIKGSASVLRQMASSSRRIQLPEKHFLGKHLKSVPARVSVAHNIETIDTAENRFVKYALRVFMSFVGRVRKKLIILNRPTDKRFIHEALSLEDNLAEILNRDFFREISEPNILPLGSSVLQRKGGYREILRVWLQFNMAARLCWSGGDDVYCAGRRDIAILYEYWTFFKLLSVASTVFNLDSPPSKELIEFTKDDFGLKLRSGRHIALSGIYSKGSRQLNIKFSYNRTFSRKGEKLDRNYPNPGSWTERMRPDYTLSLWPTEFTEGEAEAQEIIVHIHFDAKYRVESIVELFGDSDDKLTESTQNDACASEKKEEREGKYRRADLLKMHAYKDAIRRTAGAYVLYPGTESKNWRGFHEIIPGLGAFGLRPTENGEDGSSELIKFLVDISDHISDRATRRENESYQRFRIHSGIEPLSVKETPFPEYTITGKRVPPPQEISVLVAWYENTEQLQWVESTGFVVMRMDDRRGSLSLSPQNVGAQYILLHTHSSMAAPGLFLVELNKEGVPVGPRVITADTLKNKYKYPRELKEQYYLVYRVNKERHFASVRWNISQLLKVKNIAAIQSPIPFSARLDEVLTCSNQSDII